MTWGFVAAAGATVVSGSMASRSANKASGRAAAGDEAALGFEQEKYDDWKETYGGIEANLSDYYNNLTPEYFEAQGLEAFQQEQQLALTNVRSTLAQRGITDSGIAAQAEIEFANKGATSRAQIRAQAPGVAASEQRQFLQIGLGQNPGASLSSTLSQQAQQANQRANASQQVAGQATSQAVQSVGTALSDYFNRPAAPVQSTPINPASQAALGSTSALA